ncbi:hypothetical protein SCP_0503220 [Sparassis crispa]|uniref:DUF6532 domain-containing protein n=1 Tax=Sparassis crispa TaxID=139825 RepID=A0A401GNF5_9APHY|nr:hypothetical protein SCP_0503220 [Sparassis crispa]GBE83274.1 hypothetical protein SCP_0503220 [Sparassis crispa]
MPKRKSPPSENNPGSEQSSSESETRSRPHKKNARTAATAGEKQTRKVSQKQQEMNEQQARKDQNELDQLRKKVAKLQKQVKKGKQTQTATREPTEAEYEGIPHESEDEDEPGQVSGILSIGSSLKRGTAMAISTTSAMHDRTRGSRSYLRRQGSSRVATASDATAVTQPQRQPSGNLVCRGNIVTTITDVEIAESHNTPTLNAHTAVPECSPLSKDSSDMAKVVTPLKHAEFANDEPPSGCPKASDYKDDVKFLLLDATHHFECHIIGVQAYPSAETAASWAHDLWTEIVSRKSNARGDMVEETRKHIPAAYGFIVTDTSSARRKNIKLYRGLMEESTFHYKTYDLEAGTRNGFLHNPLVFKLIKECFFQMKTSYGVKYRKYFDPIHLPMLALLLTGIEHVIEEWSTGIQVSVAFREGDNERRYVNHVADIAKWAEPSPGVVRNICKKWHDRARRATGVGDEDKPTGHISATVIEDAQKELAGCTRDTDSEGEDD